MTLVAFALLAAARAQDAETVQYRDELLNVAFAHPKSWKILKKDKRLTLFEIPLAGSEDKATLEIIRSSFRSEPDIWQTVQLRTNELSKNTVVRQWEQTVLDAPLLLTQAETNLKGRTVTRLTGLHYTRTPLKMLFTMEVPSAKFEEAQYAFNQSLETLRTIDGSNFAAENPDRPATTEKPVPVNPRKTVDDGKGGSAANIKLKNELPVTVEELKSVVRYRDGWTAEATPKGVKFTSKKIQGAVEMEIGTPLDTSPMNILRQKSGESLAAFTKVERREDRDAAKNEAGAVVTWVWRRGDTAEGRRLTLDGIVFTPERFLYVRYQTSESKRFDGEQDAVNDLLNRLTIETAP